MTARLYTLVIDQPEELEPSLAAEIAEDAEPHDIDGGVARWLGSKISDVEGALNDLLPEGWKATIEEVGSWT